MKEVSKDYLIEEYTNKKKPSGVIAKNLNIDTTTVLAKLRKHNIPLLPQTGKNSKRWKGGRWKDPAGYIRVYKPEHPNAVQKYVKEHVLVMEKKIGRYIKKGEIIHHINFKKDDNRPENLILFPNNKEHSRIHTIVNSFAGELFNRGIIIWNEKERRYELI